VFERYTEKARRVILLCAYEAKTVREVRTSRPSTSYSALMREDKALANRFCGNRARLNPSGKRSKRGLPSASRISTSVEVPLSGGMQTNSKYGSEEASVLARAKHVATETPAAGNPLWRERKVFRAPKSDGAGLRLSLCAEELARHFGEKPAATRPKETSLLQIQPRL